MDLWWKDLIFVITKNIGTYVDNRFLTIFIKTRTEREVEGPRWETDRSYAKMAATSFTQQLQNASTGGTGVSASSTSKLYNRWTNLNLRLS